MFKGCTACLRKLGLKLSGRTQPKWLEHLQRVCSSGQHPWCRMFLDQLDLLSDHPLPLTIDLSIQSTNRSTELVDLITNHYHQL